VREHKDILTLLNKSHRNKTLTKAINKEKRPIHLYVKNLRLKTTATLPQPLSAPNLLKTSIQQELSPLLLTQQGPALINIQDILTAAVSLTVGQLSSQESNSIEIALKQ
jgi:hypothetical protein